MKTSTPKRKTGEALPPEALQRLPIRTLIGRVRMMNRSDFGGQNRRKKIAESLPVSRDDDSLVTWVIAFMEKHRQGTVKRQNPYLQELERRRFTMPSSANP